MTISGVITIAQQKGGAGKTTLCAHLAIGFRQMGLRVAVIDTDPQGSLGRWFMTRRKHFTQEDLHFSMASAWGVSYECDKLRREVDVILIDTPPKVDSDLRPALRAADLVLIPLASSQMDLWATEGVLDLCAREDRPVALIMNRVSAGTKLEAEMTQAAQSLDIPICPARLGQRVAFAQTMGEGLTAMDLPPSSPAHQEGRALCEAIGQMLHPAQAGV